ncbi:MAG: hypothetical protein P9G45_08635 [Candidatus Contendobacter sp.]|nr:hypothetical protein [Candidatus Contendobacter sp.]
MTGIIGTEASEEIAQRTIENGIVKNPYAPILFKQCFNIAKRFAGPIGNALTAYDVLQCLDKCTTPVYTGTYGWGP